MSHMKIRTLISLLVVAAPAAAQESIDRSMIAKIRAEGLERSHVVQMFDTIATVIGPRLTGSAAFFKAANYAKQKLAEFGARDARLESWPFGRGWELERFSIEMIEPRYTPLLGFPEAWSPSTPGEIVATPVLTAGKSAAEVERLVDRLTGGIVMQQGLMSNFITADRVQPTDPTAPAAVAPTTRQSSCVPRAPGAAAAGGRGAGAQSADAQRITQLVNDASPAVRLTATRGVHGSLFLQGGRYNAQPRSTNIVLAAEHYNMIVRLLENGVPVKLRVNSQSRFTDRDTNGYNIVAEIPGTDPRLRDEVVMAGAHIDSWHSALGAADNADGVAVMLEVMRILKVVGVQPRRTIRIAIWGGEEEGLLGSCAWTRQHLAADSAARSKFSLYLNMDPGTGPIYGFYMEGNKAAKAIFDAWLEPFKDLGYRKNLISGIGSTDHLSFIGQGVPGFNPIQDYTDYDTRVHHTNWDTPERVPLDGLKAAAVIYASMLYHAAMRDEMIPRK
jgi:carboxypeptidase Q